MKESVIIPDGNIVLMTFSDLAFIFDFTTTFCARDARNIYFPSCL
jgi:hypothetical protein